MPKAIYFFDTMNAVRTYDTYFGGLNGNFYHSYNIYFPLKTPLPNVKRITLKSVEMPLNLQNIRIESNTSTMGLNFSYTTISSRLLNNQYINYPIANGIYTQASLINALNASLSTYLYNYNAYLTLSGLTASGYLWSIPGNLNISFGTLNTTGSTLTQITNNCDSLTIDNNPLTNYILGYTNRTSSYTSGNGLGSLPGTINQLPLISNSPINLNSIDTCLYLRFTNVPNINNNSSFVGFKLPLNVNNSSTLFYNDSVEHQSIDFNQTPFLLDKINVIITDRLGNPITGYFNWTFSVIIEYDDTLSYEILNFNN